MGQVGTHMGHKMGHNGTGGDTENENTKIGKDGMSEALPGSWGDKSWRV